MSENTVLSQLNEVASRIRGTREIMGWSTAKMAKKTEVSEEQYLSYESGEQDLPFTFIHKCALAFGIEITELLEGQGAHLSSFTVTRAGEGRETAKEEGITIKNLAHEFKHKIAEPYWVKYEYSRELQDKPIHLTKHSGQEFDLVISGTLKVQVGSAVVLPGKETKEEKIRESIVSTRPTDKLLCEEFIDTTENEKGKLLDIKFKNTQRYNFAFDTVDAIADKYPDKLAMIHLDKYKNESRFTFKNMKQESNRTANYFTSLGIKKGDKVMLILKRRYQFWFSMLALHKIGAVPIPATNQLKAHDLVYRFNAASVKAIVCMEDDGIPESVEEALKESPSVETKVLVGEEREGWHNFTREYSMFSTHYNRTEDSPCGEDTMVMFFTSGTTGNPKMAAHSHLYALGHFVTAKYWHCCERDGLHLTISDTGWGKSLWGKLYGQWLCEGAVFVYDFDRFHADDLLPLFKEYNITTFCAPPTMLRMFIKEDLSKYDLSSIHHMTTAGEALNPEVFKRFEEATGLSIMEGFGQTETTLIIANLYGSRTKVGSMGKPNPQYDIDIVDENGNSVSAGETGEIVVRLDKGRPCGLYKGYYRDEEKTNEAIYDNMYHTGDTAWRDEDGYFWYVSRIDDVIKSSGYRIGPFEIESVIMELPYVLECGVSAAPDEVRGQVVKASIVLVEGTRGTEELKKEIQNYVKKNTAPYKYPRIVEFRESLPKTISGKIIRNQL